jgi:hypothetical protein
VPSEIEGEMVEQLRDMYLPLIKEKFSGIVEVIEPAEGEEGSVQF